MSDVEQEPVEIPVNWRLRPHQANAWNALMVQRKKRVALVWHRRAGKDMTLMAWTVTEALSQPGTYWHIFPTAKQGRKILWDGVTKDGRPFLSLWPRDAIVQRNDADMKLKFHNGSVWQIAGAENYNEALVGGNPRGIVFSEYALQDPRCWDYLRPILAENDGWAAFAYTPRGGNHGEALYKLALGNPNWFCEVLTVSDTRAIPLAAIDEERSAGMPEELIQQEFFCSFAVGQVGSYYGQLMEEAERDGRITKVPPERGVRVETWWDLGMRDATSIWFVQRVGREVRLIDYYEATGHGLEHYASVLHERGYVYDKHILPPDVVVRDLSSGLSRLQTLDSLGVTSGFARSVTARKVCVAEGISAVRTLLPHCWFDAERCKRGIAALKAYRRRWSEKTRHYEAGALHDWSSHGADAMRYGALMTMPVRDEPAFDMEPVQNERWDPLTYSLTR